MDWQSMGVNRYRVWYDTVNKCFRILDMWHDSIKNIPENELDKAIPDNSPAMKILCGEEVNSLIEVLKDQGWLEKYSMVNSVVPNVANKTKTIKEVAVENITKIAELDNGTHDAQVSKESIMAIREIVQKT